MSTFLIIAFLLTGVFSGTVAGLLGVGGGMIIYLAGLKNVPLSLYEAACLDGAGSTKRFFAVTLPMISPIVFFQVIMAIILSFQIFTQAFVIRGATGRSVADYMAGKLWSRIGVESD